MVRPHCKENTVQQTNTAEHTPMDTSVGTTEIVLAEESSQVPSLTSQDEQKAKAIASKINILDTDTVISYGSEAQSGMTSFADSILSQVNSGDLDEIGEKVTDIVSNVKSIDASGMNKTGNWLQKIPVLGGLFGKVKNYKLQFDSVSDHVETIAGELMSSQGKLIDRVSTLDEMYEKNLEQYRGLQVFIEAGEMKLKELRETVLPEMQTKVNQTQDTLDAQQLSDMTQAANNFEKKLHDLKLVQMSTLQTGPQIRIIQQNNRVLAEKILTTINLTIPAWKKQFTLAVALNEQKKASDLQKNVTDATNDLLRANADMLKDNSLQIAEQNERGVIDIETLEHVQTSLISTLEETLTIQEEGKKKRAQAEAKMKELESNLRTKLGANAQNQAVLTNG